ncbi:hypothetical protein C367_01498 [Cryptococcus neoformans Ze90-1]|nr:hypothetical protein C367_01498 [Cryptococcus neoformans var. grubii Ze90-1]
MVIGPEGPQFGPSGPQKGQPVWGAYHSAEIEGHCVFNPYHYVCILNHEWDNETFAKRVPLTGFNSWLRSLEDVNQQAIIGFYDE